SLDGPDACAVDQIPDQPLNRRSPPAVVSPVEAAGTERRVASAPENQCAVPCSTGGRATSEQLCRQGGAAPKPKQCRRGGVQLLDRGWEVTNLAPRTEQNGSAIEVNDVGGARSAGRLDAIAQRSG